MDKDLREALEFAAANTPGRSDIPTEIQHPSDLLSTTHYYALAYLLVLLGVLPDDVSFMNSSFWDDFA